MTDIQTTSLLVMALVSVAGTPGAPRTAPVQLAHVSNQAPARALEASAPDPRDQRSPAQLLEFARRRAHQHVQDFCCKFRRQERVKGQLRGPCELDVSYMAHPRSVHMRVLGDPKNIKRLLYVENQRVGRDGRQKMLVEPAGWRRMIVSEAEIAIDDERVLAHCRRTIDKFGFHAMLDEILRVNRIAGSRGTLDLTYEGEGLVDGRRTLVLTRRLPCGGDAPAVTVIELDGEWLLPVSVRSYADRERRELVGSYEMTQVKLNTGLQMSDFQF